MYVSRTPDSPTEAILEFFADEEAIFVDGDRKLSADDIVLEPLDQGAEPLADEAWTWRLAEGAPVPRDVGVEQFADDGSGQLRSVSPEQHTPLTEGVVAHLHDYGVFSLCADGVGNAEPLELLEYAASAFPT